MDEVERSEFELRANPVIKLMPVSLAIMAISMGVFAGGAIPSMIGRVVAWATIIGGLSYLYLITARRIVVSTDAVETELTKKIVRIPYANLDHVTVRVMPLGGMLGVKFVTKEPRSVTRTQIPLIYDEVLRSAPQLVAALIAHGVDVRVRGRRVAAS